MIHAKKIRPAFFDAVISGAKTFEVRTEDEDTTYAVGDFLALNEHAGEAYTGRICAVRITYVLHDPAFVKEGCCILGFHPAIVDCANYESYFVHSPFSVPVIAGEDEGDGHN